LVAEADPCGRLERATPAITDDNLLPFAFPAVERKIPFRSREDFEFKLPAIRSQAAHRTAEMDRRQMAGAIGLRIEQRGEPARDLDLH
jgi:hypothetical protein